MREYRLGPNLYRLLENFQWSYRIVPKIGKYLGIALGTGRGLNQGDPSSPMIFNIVVYVVVWAVIEEVFSPQEAQHSMRWEAGERNIFLCG